MMLRILLIDYIWILTQKHSGSRTTIVKCRHFFNKSFVAEHFGSFSLDIKWCMFFMIQISLSVFPKGLRSQEWVSRKPSPFPYFLFTDSHPRCSCPLHNCESVPLTSQDKHFMGRRESWQNPGVENYITGREHFYPDVHWFDSQSDSPVEKNCI
jgi:hypothetical protein